MKCLHHLGMSGVATIAFKDLLPHSESDFGYD